MIYRTFWLTNYLGQEYSLNSSKVFLYTPSGLGFTKSYEATSMGNVEVVTAELVNLSDVSGELLFNGSSNADKYGEYDNFINFIREKPLKLHYMPPNANISYNASVVITSLDKSEINSSDGLLHCPISMHMTTHWESDDVIEIVIDTNDLNGKSYPLDYPYAYGGMDLNNLRMINKGTEEIGFELEITGAMENPEYIIYDANFAPYGDGAWTGTFDYFYINSSYEDESVILKRSDIPLVNPMNYQNLDHFLVFEDVRNTEYDYNFIQLRCGLSTMVLTFANEFSGVVKVRFKPRYATV